MLVLDFVQHNFKSQLPKHTTMRQSWTNWSRQIHFKLNHQVSGTYSQILFLGFQLKIYQYIDKFKALDFVPLKYDKHKAEYLSTKQCVLGHDLQCQKWFFVIKKYFFWFWAGIIWKGWGGGVPWILWKVQEPWKVMGVEYLCIWKSILWKLYLWICKYPFPHPISPLSLLYFPPRTYNWVWAVHKPQATKSNPCHWPSYGARG